MPSVKIFSNGTICRAALILVLCWLSACTANVKDGGDEAVRSPASPEQSATSKQADIPRDLKNAFDLAVGEMKQGNYPRAEQQLKELIKLYPDYSGLYHNLGIIYHLTGRLNEAETALQWALERNRGNSQINNQLAVVYRKNGKFSDAEQSYLRALSLSPDDTSTLVNLAILYDLYMGRQQQALEYYRKYQNLQQQPDAEVANWIKDLERRVAKGNEQ